MSLKKRISLTVNGLPVIADVEPRTHLVDFLREELHLKGPHLGCEQGACGACTVKVDGQIIRGCLYLAIQADGSQVETVEGLTKSGVSIAHENKKLDYYSQLEFQLLSKYHQAQVKLRR